MYSGTNNGPQLGYLTINVGDENEFGIDSIDDTNIVDNAIDENAEAGTEVGIAAFAEDTDGSASITYSLHDDGAGASYTGPFEIDANTGVVTVREGYSPDQLNYEENTQQNFFVKALSSDGSQAFQTFTVDINDVNETPFIISDFSFDTNEGQPITISDADLLAHLGDVEGDDLSITLVLSEAFGDVVNNGDGTYTITPAPGFDGELPISFEASDGTTILRDTFNVNVAPVNEAVIAVDDTQLYSAAPLIRLDSAPEHGRIEYLDAQGDYQDMIIGLTYDADTQVRFVPNTHEIRLDTADTFVGSDENSASLSDWGDVNGDTAVWQNGNMTVTTTVSSGNLTAFNDPTGNVGVGIGNDQNGGGGLSHDETLTIDVDGEGISVNQISLNLGGLGEWFDETSANATEIVITAYDENGDLISEQGGYRQSGGREDTYTFTFDQDVSHFILSTSGGPGDYVVNSIDISSTMTESAEITTIQADGSEISNNVDFILNNNTAEDIIDLTAQLIEIDNSIVATDFEVAEDSSLTINSFDLLVNDIDGDNDALSIVSVDVTASSNGTVVLSPDGSQITFTPDANYNGAANFTYIVTDNNGTQDEATVSFNVTAVDDAIAINGPLLIAGAEDTVIQFTDADLLTNVSNVDNHVIDVSNVVVAGNGTLTSPSAGVYRFTPDANFNGDVQISFDIADEFQQISTTATLELSATNDAPTISAPATAIVDEDNSLTLTQADLLANASDIDGDTLTASNVQLVGADAAVVDNGDGTFTITPSSNFSGDIELTFDVSDGIETVPATGMVTVDPVADAALLNTRVQRIGEDIETTTTANFSSATSGVQFDISSDSLQNVGGGHTVNGEDSAIYSATSANGSSHDDRFKAENLSAGDSFTIAGGAGNDTLDLSAFRADQVKLTFANGSGNAIIDLDGDGDFSDTSENAVLNFSSIEDIKFDSAVFDGNPHGFQSTSTDATWTAEGESISLDSTGASTHFRIGLLEYQGEIGSDFTLNTTVNPSSASGQHQNGLIIFDYQDALNYKYVGAWIGGEVWTMSSVVNGVSSEQLRVGDTTLAANTDNSITLHVNGDTAELWNEGVLIGSHTYTGQNLSDGEIGIGAQWSDTTFNIDMGPSNWAPSPEDIDLVLEYTSGAVTIDLLANAVDAENDTLTVTNVSLVGTGDAGSVVNNGDGTITYTPTGTGTESFEYTINDGSSSSTGRVYLDIQDNWTISIDEDESFNLTASMSLIDTDGSETGALSISDIPEGVTISDGVNSFTASAGNTELDLTGWATTNMSVVPELDNPNNFTLNVNAITTDSNGDTQIVTNTMNILVTPVNDAPVLHSTSHTTNEDNSIILTEADLLGSSTDIDGDTLTVNAANYSGSDGTLTNNGDSTWTFTPNANFSGDVSISVDISDGVETISTTASVTVAPVADAPDIQINTTDSIVFATDNFDSSVSNWTGTNAYLQGSGFGTGNALTMDSASGIISKEFTVPEGTQSVTLSFSAYEIESWDGEEFRIYVNDEVYVTDNFRVNDAESGTEIVFNQSGEEVGTVVHNTEGNFVGYAPWLEQSHVYTIQVPINTETGTVKIGFDTDLDESSVNEQFQIDSLSLSANYEGLGDEDSAIALDFSAALTDLDGDEQLTISLSDVPDGAILSAGTFAGNGVWELEQADLIGLSLTPPSNFNGTIDLTVNAVSTHVSNGETATTTDTLTVVVDAMPDDVVTISDANVDANSVDENALAGTTVGITALATDPDGDAVTYSLHSDGVGNTYTGPFEINAASGAITVRAGYSPDELNHEVNPTQSVFVKATSSDGSEIYENFTVNVNDINEAPTTTGNISATVNEDATITLTQAQLLANASDVDGDALTATNPRVLAALFQPANGSVVDNGDGTFTITPDPDYNGTIQISYSISDASKSITSRVILSVDPVNDAPDSATNVYSATEDQSFVLSDADLLTNATDLEGDSISVTNVSYSGTDGTLEQTAAIEFGADTNNRIEIDTRLDSYDAFTMQVEYTAIGTPSGSMQSLISAPTSTANQNHFNLFINNPDGSLDGHLFGDYYNFSNSPDFNDGGTHEITIAWDSASGVLSAFDNGVLFDSVTIRQGNTMGAGGYAIIGQEQDTYGGSFDGNQAVTDSLIGHYTMSYDRISNADIETGAELADLSNDLAFDVRMVNDIVVDASPTSSTLTLAGDLTPYPQYEFTPNENFNGEISFDVEYSDGVDVRTVNHTIDFAGTYDAITTSSGGSASAIENSILTLSLGELTSHINNPENATLNISNMTVTNGSVVDNGDDTYTFTPVTDFNGDMTTNYDVNDGTTTINTSTDITVLNEVVGTLLDDNLDGGFDADAIYGLAGNDILQGSSGDDTILGASGNDTLTGGAGEDSFVFELGDQGTVDTPAQDTITDFEVGVDHLDISDFLSSFASETGVELSDLVDLREEGGNTIISLKSDGTNVDQEIVVENTSIDDFYGGDSSSATEGDILQKMIDDNNLINTSG